jgi:hypothetical protein
MSHWWATVRPGEDNVRSRRDGLCVALSIFQRVVNALAASATARVFGEAAGRLRRTRGRLRCVRAVTANFPDPGTTATEASKNCFRFTVELNCCCFIMLVRAPDCMMITEANENLHNTGNYAEPAGNLLETRGKGSRFSESTTGVAEKRRRQPAVRGCGESKASTSDHFKSESGKPFTTKDTKSHEGFDFGLSFVYLRVLSGSCFSTGPSPGCRGGRRRG